MILLFFLLFISPFVNCERIVETNSGPIRGISLDTKNVEAFLGIPYAEPPVGSLRFAKPVPKSPWTNILEAREMSSACIQGMLETFNKMFNESIKMEEDCLYLNLWVPKSESTSKPIMVWIHGGGFMAGTANMNLYDGTTLSEHGDVIVASINYRVGSLGFFSGFIDEAAGSMGMYDQVMAIQWIKDNAKYFGGDPDNIVLFGESAGAWSVSLHMISPLSKNLFRRGIQQSGSIIHPMYSDSNDVLRIGSQTVSKLVGCSENDDELKENPKKVVECMKKLPPEEFAKADENLYKKLAMLIPRVGDEFLPKSPADLYRNKEFKDTELLMGITRDEGTMFLSFRAGLESGDVFGTKINPDTFTEIKARELVRPFSSNKDYERIVERYFKRVKEEARYTYLNAISDILGDSIITCGTMFQADIQSLQKHPVYFYVFDYRSPSSPFADWLGVYHFHEVQFVFGNPMLQEFSENEKELSMDIMDMWTTFAKTGNPSIPGGLKWPQYTYDDPKYVILSMRDRVGIKPDNYRCEAWRDLFRSRICLPKS